MRGIFIAALVLLTMPALAQSLNPAVTQNTIDETICVRGWTKTIRPPAAYTTRLKIEQLRAMGLPGHASDYPGHASGYEEDHVIPLGLGGAPYDPANLRPQPWDEANLKDEDEYRLNQAVCAGRISLEQAQLQMRTWVGKR